MHYIQNSLFINYGVWLLSFLFLMVCVIFYIQNNKHSLRKSIAVFFVFLFLNLIAHFSISKVSNISNEETAMNAFKVNQDRIQSTSSVLYVLHFLKNMISTKISE
ncbi:MAG: hypothetical protein UZ11_BCD004000389 [Bacteroidetes bacterium OLB11]|nr:MAG: hypothetical protein UZ11_BCD004000389 [Bacteroidetes bacterium OLB11]